MSDPDDQDETGFDRFLKEKLKNPEFARIYNKAREEIDALQTRAQYAEDSSAEFFADARTLEVNCKVLVASNNKLRSAVEELAKALDWYGHHTGPCEADLDPDGRGECVCGLHSKLDLAKDALRNYEQG